MFSGARRSIEQSGIDAQFGETLNAGLFDLVEFPQRFLNVSPLLPKIGAFFLDALHEQLQLPCFAGRLTVHLDDLVDFRDGKTEPLAAQDLLYQMAIGRTEQSRATASYRSDQAFVFVETQSTG